ncbi:MAG: dienelactone hydrolase family protein [Acidobacteriota bacterium]
MVKKLILMLVIIQLSFSGLSAVNTYKANEEGYKKMRAELGTLFREKKYREGVILLKAHYNKYPDHLMSMSFNLAIMYNSIKEYKKGIKVMLNAQKKGIWYSPWVLEGEFFKGFKPYKKYKKVLAVNKKLHASAETKAKSFFEIMEPENFDKKKPYPLFIALHGGDGHIEEFKPRWGSEKLKKEFIVLFIQSSQMSSMNGYHWEDTEKAYREVKVAFNKVIEKYNIDNNKIIIGGFSSGGGASLHLSFNGDIPVSGFIALCPALPETITGDKISAADKKGVTGTILTTEFDRRIKTHRELADKMKAQGLQYQFVVTPNIGHWFPKDLDKKIDQAIVHIFSR